MSSRASAPSILFFGLSGVLSALPFRALLDAGRDVRALVLPFTAGLPALPAARVPVSTAAPLARGRPVPLAAPPERSARQLAEERGIPVLRVASLRRPEALAALASFAPDLICVSCFSLRLPPDVLRLPRLGCVNLHPSLLPDNRGPDPLFWTFQRGDAATGVTTHLMDEGFDTGPILAQERVDVPIGVGEAQLERALATLGGALLTRTVDLLAGGAAHPTPQDEAAATYYPLPAPDDYTIHADWPAARAYRFARGVSGRGEPITIAAPGARFRLLAPLGYDETAAQHAPWRLDGDGTLSLRCAPGIFRARVGGEGSLTAAPAAPAAPSAR
jgi:methionyl-tRNA formyltransferase